MGEINTEQFQFWLQITVSKINRSRYIAELDEVDYLLT